MSARNRGPGRPKMAEGEAMSRQLTCRVRPSEEARMRRAAEKAGVTFAEWMRRTLLTAAGMKAEKAVEKPNKSGGR